MRKTATDLSPEHLYPAVEFDPDIAESIVDAIYSGKTITSALEDVPYAPTYSTFSKWRREYPEFNQAIVWARQAVADKMVEEVNDIAVATLTDPENVPAANAKVAIDAKKWIASKFNPRTYGDRLALEGEVTLSARLAQMNDDELDQAIIDLTEDLRDDGQQVS
jgi:hypothetical protein